MNDADEAAEPALALGLEPSGARRRGLLEQQRARPPAAARAGRSKIRLSRTAGAGWTSGPRARTGPSGATRGARPAAPPRRASARRRGRRSAARRCPGDPHGLRGPYTTLYSDERRTDEARVPAIEHLAPARTGSPVGSSLVDYRRGQGRGSNVVLRAHYGSRRMANLRNSQSLFGSQPHWIESIAHASSPQTAAPTPRPISCRASIE